uniref:Uncharacterized protein n=1 Tax=Tenacibaculum sp. Pbs-1 TaxID=3238748 RepID=A0AB33KUM8_9FLAO
MILLTYISYLTFSIAVVFYVGSLCFQNGKIYTQNYFPNDLSTGNAINNTLLTAYYCLNIGLAIWSLNSINEIEGINTLLVELCLRFSFILLVIGILHFSNIYMVHLIHKHLKK